MFVWLSSLHCFGFVADDLEHWTVTANGGDEFVVEPDKCSGSESVSTIGISGKLLLLLLLPVVLSNVFTLLVG